MERYCGIVKEQVKHNLLWQCLISVVILLASPLVLGIENLDAAQSAKVLEMYVAVIGIVLFIPVFLPEQNQDLRDLIQSKYTKIISIYIIRVLLTLVVSMALVFVYMYAMKQGNCQMETGKYFFGTLAEMLAFGGVGILAYAISDNLIVGYMAPVMYYVAAFGSGEKYLKKFYLFGMVTDYQTKYVLFAAGVLCMAVGILWRGRKHC